VKPWVGVPTVPVLAVQLKVSALPSPSSAITRRVTLPPPATEVADWFVRTMRGGMLAPVPGPTQMRSVPWPRPPLVSVTATVSGQLPHGSPVGTALGVKDALGVLAPVHVPAQAAVHW
jgi:hypothetical protein